MRSLSMGFLCICPYTSVWSGTGVHCGGIEENLQNLLRIEWWNIMELDALRFPQLNTQILEENNYRKYYSFQTGGRIRQWSSCAVRDF